eukprot:gnl/Spiro4/15974_TR8589_c0_g1_i1.p1 gnl/Spiro4/15974_TR8589_c0_g1~~gnl/Spiro4/15974_TR8589_c0_g1_i1.p1  ORF type:complete len:752 (-),score=234.34 gnl/Spiro4/15974_TR8589_c0_g1_i1:207-2432(-)
MASAEGKVAAPSRTPARVPPPLAKGKGALVGKAKKEPENVPLISDEFVHEIYMGYSKDQGEGLDRMAEGKQMIREMLEANVTVENFRLRHKGVAMHAAGAISKLLKNRPVQRINLYGNCVSNYGARDIIGMSRSTPTLKHINLGANMLTFDDDGGAVAKIIKDTTTLVTLELGSSKKAGSSANQIGSDACGLIGDALLTNTSLTYLGLNYNRIGADNAEGCISLGNMLGFNTTLTTLKLAGNQLEDAAVEHLLYPIHTNNRTLRYLSLSDNSLRTEETARALALILANTPSFAVLLLAHNHLEFRGARILADALRLNRSLVVLDIGNNNIGDQGAVALSEALCQNNTLTSLSLKNNGIHDEGWAALAQLLCTNAVLARLDVSQNRSTVSGCVAIAEALTVNRSLVELNLGSTRTGDEGGAVLGAALLTHPALTALHLNDNFLHDVSGAEFVRSLEFNHMLTTLDLTSNPIANHVTLRAIAAFTARNTRRAKAQEPNRLKDEIHRLTLQENRLFEALEELARQQQLTKDAESAKEQHVHNQENQKIQLAFDMGNMQSELKKLQATRETLTAELAAKKDEIELQKQTMLEQAEFLSSELKAETERVVAARATLESITKQMQELVSTRDERLKHILDESEATRKENEEKKVIVDEMREKYYELKKTVEEAEERKRVSDALKVKMAAAASASLLGLDGAANSSAQNLFASSSPPPATAAAATPPAASAATATTTATPTPPPASVP